MREFHNEKVILEEALVEFHGLGKYLKQAPESKIGRKTVMLKREQIEEYKKLFDAYDTDRSGALGTEEIAKAFSAVGEEG